MRNLLSSSWSGESTRPLKIIDYCSCPWLPPRIGKWFCFADDTTPLRYRNWRNEDEPYLKTSFLGTSSCSTLWCYVIRQGMKATDTSARLWCLQNAKIANMARYGQSYKGSPCILVLTSSCLIGLKTSSIGGSSCLWLQSYPATHDWWGHVI